MSCSAVIEEQRQKRYKSVKDYFVKLKATDSQHAIAIKSLRNDLKSTIKRLQRERIIKAIDNRYYFDLKAEKRYLKRKSQHNITLAIIFLILVGIGVLFSTIPLIFMQNSA